MNIIVCLKPVPDAAIVSIDPFDPHRIDPNDIVYIANPSDLAALEVATGLKEVHTDSKITIVSAAPPITETLIRKFLAFGGDDAITIWDVGFDQLEGFAMGCILGKLISLLPFDLVLCGKMSSDTCAGYVPYIISEYLDAPVASEVTSIRIQDRTKEIIAECKLEKGKRKLLKMNMPAVFGVDESIAQVHYPSFPDVIEAQRKAIHHWNVSDLDLSVGELINHMNLENVEIAIPRPKPKKPFTPDSNLSAVERMQLVLSGGVTKKNAILLEDRLDVLSKEFANFLHHHWITLGHTNKDYDAMTGGVSAKETIKY